MYIDIQECENGYHRLLTDGLAQLYFRRHSSQYHISTDARVMSGSSKGWWFDEVDLRQAAELLLRLADELEDEKTAYKEAHDDANA